jgi:hypothetical protein
MERRTNPTIFQEKLNLKYNTHRIGLTLRMDGMTMLIMRGQIMNTILKPRIFILILPLVLFLSCGPKNNKVPVQNTMDSSSGTPYQPGTPYTTVQMPANLEILQQIEQVKQAYPCLQQTNRIEFSFYVPVNGQISNQLPVSELTTQFPPTSNVSRAFAGKFIGINDLLFVVDVAVGSKVAGRAIIVSLCQQQPLITPQRPIALQMVTPLIVSVNPYCVLGNVYGDFMITGAAYMNYAPFQTINRFTHFDVCGATN